MSRKNNLDLTKPLYRLQADVPTKLLAEVLALTKDDALGTREATITALGFYKTLLAHRGQPITLTMHDARMATIHPNREFPKD